MTLQALRCKTQQASRRLAPIGLIDTNRYIGLLNWTVRLSIDRIIDGVRHAGASARGRPSFRSP
eukprot:6886179-Lingulodinium_polyedra.AAC.1